MTPAQFAACTEAFEQQREWTDWHFSRIIAVLANVHRKRGTPAFKVDDFMPNYGKEKADKTEGELLNFWETQAVPLLQGKK